MVLADTSVRINIGMPHREQTTGFGSQHHGGVWFLMGDGGARFINQNIDTSVFRNLSVINDGKGSQNTNRTFPDEGPIKHHGNSD